MKILQGSIIALCLPFAYLDLLGGIVAGIWLGILGRWGTIGIGLLFYFTAIFLINRAMRPTRLLAPPVVYCAKKGKTCELIFFSALSNLFVITVMTAWCCGVLFMFVKDTAGGSLIPLLIWSYGVATGPWAYMASMDQDAGRGPGTVITTFLAQIAYVIMFLMVIFSTITSIQALKVFAGFMLVGWVIQMVIVYLMPKACVLR
ncbi:MAG: hypothetical protein ACLPX5_04230 [Dissulfurispiraceae bacterium]